MDEVMETLERVKQKSLESNRGTQMSEPTTDEVVIEHPTYPGDLLPLEGYLDHQGWHRNSALAGKTFDNFEATTPELVARLKFASQYAARETGKDSLLLWGSPGRGKSHLARGIMAEEAKAGTSCIYWPLMQLVAMLKGMMGKYSIETPDSYVDWLCRFDGLLVIDELGRSAGGNWDRDQVIYPLADRRQHKRTVWISNYSPDQLTEIYDEAIVSRLMAGSVVSFLANHIEDRRTRR